MCGRFRLSTSGSTTVMVKARASPTTTGSVDAPTYDRARLKSGNRIEGPALIEEHASTTVVEPKDVLTVDAFGNLHIDIWRN